MKLRVHPSFIAFLFVYTFIGGLFDYLVAFAAVLFHEFCHLLIARVAGERGLIVTLMPYGASLTISGESGKTAAILLAGPIGSLLAASISLSLAWLIPETYGLLKGFVRANVSVALVNLLPAYPLDGGRLIRELLPFKGAKTATSAMTLLLSIFFFTLFFIGKMRNLTLLTFSVFMLLYFLSFTVRRAFRASIDDPLYSIVRTDGEGNFRAVVVRCGKKRVRLSGSDVARLVLKYSSDLTVGDALERESAAA